MAPYFEPYSEYLADRGYSQVSYWKKTFFISEFSRWLGMKRIAANAIVAEHKEVFLRYSATRRTPKGGQRGALDGITSWLQHKGVIDGKVAAPTKPSSIEAILQEYVVWSREERGLAPNTGENYAGYVRRVLSNIRGTKELRLADVKASQITDYLRRNAPRDRTFSNAKNTVSALRSFFRFARHRDYIQTDLAAAVPSVAGWSMASIPRAMPADCVRRLLRESKTWRNPVGLRNRAILLLLARLGLRAGEIVHLELDDIDWSHGWLKVHGKGRQERPLPLPHDVGEAIASYLKNGRPESTCRRAFLRSRAPFDGLKTHSDICQIVRRAIEQAGLELDFTGSHQLRHALAVDMLRQGISLTEIGQVLRHRHPDTTRRYAKVDIEGLREVALPWPGALP
ncbi:MAG: tyrosine-type recombinase/integrase [Alphaproteobacteria bacterium]|nr:tyrosine-type recombinase/integrase [Alphaproteobacteria bacterium]